MNRKAGTLLLMLALLLPASASVRADGVESRAGVDFVHTPSVFDTCYSAFRRVSQVYRHYSHLGAAVLKDRSLSDKVNRISWAPVAVRHSTNRCSSEGRVTSCKTFI